MDKTYWLYKNQNSNIVVEKMPVYFELESEDGNKEQGSVIFKSHNQYDDTWGSDSKFTVSWEKIDRATYHHGKKVRETIKMYNAIEVAITNKETEWLNSHELTKWYGTRKQLVRRGFYVTKIIHGIMMCEQTDRVIEAHSTTVLAMYPNYEPYILEAIKSIRCH